jgi:hypothetical protein
MHGARTSTATRRQAEVVIALISKKSITGAWKQGF